MLEAKEKTILKHADSYKELVVYQKAKSAANDIYQVTKSFPKEEMYSLTDQVRRSSRSIGAQIAEAWGKRRYKKHFISKLTDADAEQLETQHWIEVAKDCGYLTSEQVQELILKLSEVGRMIFSMINKANLFCSESTES